ncbi:MAG: lysoplasmalogenase [Spirochaetota bacterium]
MNVLTTLTALFLSLFAIREYVAYKRKLSLKYFFTPMLTFSVILIVFLSVAVKGPTVYSMLVLIALIMALIADTLLMIEEMSFLKNGLIFFLISHVFYILAFKDGYTFQAWNLGLIIFLAAASFFNIRLVKKGAGRLLIPVIIYVIILNVMGFFAITRLNSGFGLFEVSLATGAVMFIISDFILSINAFVKKIPHSTVYTWLFYAPAQFLFALSTLH